MADNRLVNPSVVVLTVVLGFGSGVLAGMFGVGGAVLTTPGLRAVGVSPIQAVGSTVPAILPGALSGTYRYAKEGLVNWRIGLICGSTGAMLAVGGAWVADLVDAHYLMLLTAAILGWSGASIYRSGRQHRHTAPDPDLPTELVEEVGLSPTGEVGGSAAPAASVERLATTLEPTRTFVPASRLALVGAAAGFLAGLLGVGGGIVMMPAFTGVLHIPIKEAVASSLVAVAVFSLPALVTHAALGHIDWGFALLLAVGVVPGAQVGSKLTLGASDSTVRSLFGAFVVVLSVIYGVGEILAIV